MCHRPWKRKFFAIKQLFHQIRLPKQIVAELICCYTVDIEKLYRIFITCGVKPIEKIKQKVGRWKLKRNLKNRERNKTFHNFNTAQTVGIIFDATDHQNYEVARNFGKFLNERKIRIYGLGFADSKEVMNFYSYYTGFNFFTIKDSNWQGIPNNHNVKDFINKEIDILIDLHRGENFQLEYISAMSKAEFKIGPFTTKPNYYDFMIDISTNPTSDFLCEQIKHYLSIINNDKSK